MLKPGRILASRPRLLRESIFNTCHIVDRQLAGLPFTIDVHPIKMPFARDARAGISFVGGPGWYWVGTWRRGFAGADRQLHGWRHPPRRPELAARMHRPPVNRPVN